MNKHIIFFDESYDQVNKVSKKLKNEFNIIVSRSYAEVKELIDKLHPFLLLINTDHFNTYLEDIYHRLNKNSPQTIYMVYSLHKNKKEKIFILKNYADDCIYSKNPSDEIIAKIISFYRRIQTFFEQPKIICTGNIEINYSTREITKNNKSVVLTDSQFKILDLLISKPEHIFTRKEILKSVFSKNQHISKRAVDVYIRRLRKNIHDIGYDENIIQTVQGLGYKFYNQ